MPTPFIAQYRTARPTRNTTRASGFTLIEVLVTLLVLAIGILGLASLQIQGLRGTHDALLQTQASALAVAMAERLRAHTSADDPFDTQEMQEWKAQLARRLPEGDGSVTIDSTAITVHVLWNERGSARHYALSFTP